MKIGGSGLADDLARIEAVLDVVGEGRYLAVDVNGRFDLETSLAYARAIEPLESARAIGRLEADGPWIGFGYRGGLPRFVVGVGDGMRDGAGDRDLLLALAIAYFADAGTAAPPELEARSERLFFGQGGIRLDLAGGPDLVFGDADGAAEKWKAAARVLADDSSAGATYLDLRVAGLVAAGGVGPLDPEPEPTPAPETAPTAAVPFEPSTAG